MLSGKGYYIHYIPRIGNLRQAAEEAQVAGISHVIVKVLDGTRRGNSPGYPAEGNVWDGVDLVPPLIQEFRRVGIEVWGFHAVYGYAAEAAVALSTMDKLGLDGWVIDAESSMKGKHTAARRYMVDVRANTSLPLALSSYRYPSLHPELPWKEYLENGIDINMPQVYWEQAHNAAVQLNRSVLEFENLYAQLRIPHVPIFPTGAAYSSGNWTVTDSDINSFMTEAKQLVAQKRIMDGVNFWEWYWAKDKTRVWPTIGAFEWGTNPVPPPPNVPYAIGRGRVLATAGLSIRDFPARAGNYRGAWGVNATPYIFELYRVNSNEEWAKVGHDLWSAVRYNGVQLMRIEETY